MAASSAAFLRWAAAYDTAGPEQRSRAAHEAWLASQTAPVLRLDSSEPVARLVAAVQSAIRQRDERPGSRASGVGGGYTRHPSPVPKPRHRARSDRRRDRRGGVRREAVAPPRRL
jgi:hypothetical protein